MDSDDDFGGFGIPTPLEMWKHQVVLLTTEIQEYQRDLRRARSNIAKLIDINASVTVDRDALREELRINATKLSEAYRELAMTKNTLAGYLMAQGRTDSHAVSYAPPSGYSAEAPEPPPRPAPD
jgi:hypothetical protein